MNQVAVIVLPNVLDSALALVLEVLATANRLRIARGERAAFEVRTYGVRSRTTRTGLGFDLRTDARLADLEHAPSILILPGENEVDGHKLIEHIGQPLSRALLACLKRCARSGTTIAASCTGTFYLAESGLLDARTATTTWFLAPHFRARFPNVSLTPDATLVRDGRLWTAGAAFSALDLALAIVQRFAGVRVERDVVRYLAAEKHPTQARYMMTAHLSSSTTDTARAEAYVRANLTRALSMAELAGAVNLSTRTFARRITHATGLSPLRFVQRIRAEHAVHLLETTSLSLDDVSQRVGYDDVSTLRRILRREMQLGAREIRARRSARGATVPRARPA